MSVTKFRSIPRPSRSTLVAVGLAVVMLAACSPARAQAPVAGQAYQIPAGYESYAPGTILPYGGYNYVVQSNGTMMLGQQTANTTYSSAPVSGQAYQVPAGYEAYAAGTTISYGGYSYVLQGNGTMVLATQPGYTSYYVPPTTSYYPPTTNYYPPGNWWGPGPGRGPGPGPRRDQWTTGMFGQPIRVPGNWQRVSGNMYRNPRTGGIMMVD